MGLYRDENGLVFETDDTFARTQGYEPVSPEDEHSMLQAEAIKSRQDDRGVIGDVNAAVTGAASSLTLGGSDYLMGELMTPAERQQLQADIEAHPYLRAGGEVAGALVGGFAAPGSIAAKTPAGYLGSIASQGVEHALERGGMRGVGQALGVMGTEGALQSAGQYIGWSSLQDKDATVEGLAGALGTGFAFGSLGGGAALGVTKGTIAARRLFSRAMDGNADAMQSAESVWTKTQQEMLEADTSNANKARARLEEIRNAKMEALRYKNETKAGLAEEKLRASTAQKPVAEPVDPLTAPVEGGMPTSVFKRPEEIGPFSQHGAGGAAEFDLSLPNQVMEDGTLVPTELMAPSTRGEVTSVFTTPTTEVIPPSKTLPKTGTEVPKMGSEAPTDLEKQLAGTKAALDNGKKLQDIGENAVPGSAVSPQIPPGKKPLETPGRNPSRAVEDMLAEKKLGDMPSTREGTLQERLRGEVPKTDKAAADAAARHQGSITKTPDFGEQLGPTKKQRFGNLRTQLGQELDVGPRSGAKPTELQGPIRPLSELRSEKTAELLGQKVADEEAKLLSALGDWEQAQPHLTNEFLTLGGGGDPVSKGQLAELRRQWNADLPTGVGHRKLVDALDQAHEEALQRVAEASDVGTRGEAVRTAKHLEDLLERVNTPMIQTERGQLGGVVDWMNEIEHGAGKAQQYEKASAKLAEVLGEDAHPISQQYAKAASDAEREAEKRMFDRAARAVDDAQEFGPEYKTPKERVRYASERKLEADRAYNDIHLQEKQASRDYQAANEKRAAGEKAKRAAIREDAKAAKAAGVASKATTFGGILEIADLPGLPKPSDIPVVGPLLGAWLKYKTLKAAMGKLGGRVAATADARVATLAARTRDRVARAVDRSLGVGVKVGTTGMKVLPKLSGVISKRIYDDGLPDAKAGADMREVAAVRMRELQAYVQSPNAIEMDVRRELRGVSDPDIIAAAEKHRRAMMEYLASQLPKVPQNGILEKTKWQPSGLQALSFARRMEAASDPAGLLERLASTQQMISLEAAETLRQVYPTMFLMAQQRLLQRAADPSTNVPYSKRVHLSLIYKLPLDSSLNPDRLNMTQSIFEKTATPAPVSPDQPAAPPTPSVAQPTNIAASYMTPEERRSLTR